MPIKSNHILWSSEKFDYPNPNNKIVNNIIYKYDLSKLTEMSNKQTKFINNYFGNTNINNNTIISNMKIEDDEDDEDDEDYEDDEDDKNFEVEKIINYRIFKKRMKFLVKWNDYDEKI